MRRREAAKFRPDLEACEPRQLLSAHPSAASPRVSSDASAGVANAAASRQTAHRSSHLILNRITNPTPFNAQLNPPFRQVLVQSTQPVPGAQYNVLSVSVRNSTSRTFDANSGLSVRITGQPRGVPVLTGTDRWTPGQVRVFYVLTEKYYPLSPHVSAGFEFDLDGDRGVAIPGPSGIFLRVKYNPTTFAKTLDWIVAHGPGSKGHALGLPDTAIWEILPAGAPGVVPLGADTGQGTNATA